MMLRQIANRLGKGSVNKQFTRTNRQYNRTYAAPKRLSASRLKNSWKLLKNNKTKVFIRTIYVYIYIYTHIYILTKCIILYIINKNILTFYYLCNIYILKKRQIIIQRVALMRYEL